MRFLKKVLKGFLVGVGAVAPGISGGVIAAVIGIYEPIMEALANFHKNIRKNFLFLLPYIAGAGIGFIFFGNIIGFLMSIMRTQILFLFSGLVIGSFPSLVKEANKSGFKYRYLLFFSAAYLLMTSSSFILAIPIKNSFLRYLSGGAVYSMGSIIPGISASFILINMGIYEELLSNISSLNVLIPFSTGFIITSIFLIKGVNLLFKKFHAPAYYIVMGFLSANIITALPILSIPLLDIFILTAAIIFGYLFTRI